MHDVVGIYIFVFGACLAGAGLFYRHKVAEMKHRERMSAMEKGVALPVFAPAKPQADPIRRHLLAGLIWTFSGAALATFVFALTITLPQPRTETLEERKAKIEVLQKFGASDDELRRVIRDQDRNPPRLPIGLWTVGLIPMGVGIAYLIYYRAERVRYSPVQ